MCASGGTERFSGLLREIKKETKEVPGRLGNTFFFSIFQKITKQNQFLVNSGDCRRVCREKKEGIKKKK